MLGGAFLCFEGVEKVLHSLEARKHKEDPERRQQRPPRWRSAIRRPLSVTK